MARIPAQNIDLVATDGMPQGNGQPFCVSFLRFFNHGGEKRGKGLKEKEEECE